MNQKVAIVGSRHFPNREPVEKFIQTLPSDTIILSGGAIGVDAWAEETARTRGLSVEIKHADWEGLGRKAGPIRNAEIVRDADQIVAFWDGKSRGTLNTVVQAWRAGVPVRVFDSAGDEIALTSAIEAARAKGIVNAIDAACSQATK